MSQGISLSFFKFSCTFKRTLIIFLSAFPSALDYIVGTVFLFTHSSEHICLMTFFARELFNEHINKQVILRFKMFITQTQTPKDEAKSSDQWVLPGQPHSHSLRTLAS